MKTTKEMTKEELVARVEELEQIVLNLQNKKGRKFEVLELLRSNTSISIVEISEKLGISTKNVSSQLTYLREEGYNVCTNSQGRKFLVEEKKGE
jgi:biotin operon repressor